MFRRYKGQFFKLPNILCYFRILLIPVYLTVYFNAGDNSPMAAAIILGVAALTDFTDGKIARKFNMQTEWGKLLDPIADKLLQIAVVVSLTFRFIMMRYLLILLLVKEAFMAITGFLLMRKGRQMDTPQWYGRFNTFYLFLTMIILLACGNLTYFYSGLIICFCFAVTLFSFVCYIVFYIRMSRNVPLEKNTVNVRKTILIVVIVFVVFICFEAITVLAVYSDQPDIPYDKIQEASSFFGDGTGAERAMIIEDNEDALFDRIYMIENARESIYMSTFDFRSDNSGMIVAGALIDAAERGVQVHLLVDGINSWLQMEWNPYFYALSSCENVVIKVYNKANPLIPWKSIARTHDKYLIADNTAYILGGRNTYDRFLGNYTEYRNYDRDVLVYSEKEHPDNSVHALLDYAYDIWNDDACSTFHDTSYIADWACVRNARKEITEAYNSYICENSTALKEYDYVSGTVAVNKITLISGQTDCGMKEPVIWGNLCNLIMNANDEVKIHTPYIICNDVMYDSLSAIANSEADVILMTNSAPNNDNPVGASEYEQHKEEILQTGVNVWEFNGTRAYHGKTILIDDRISIVGSFNMDIRSTYLDTELMLVIDSEELNGILADYMETYEKQSILALPDGEYYNPYNVTPTEYTLSRKTKMLLIKYLMSWARCLF